jgi:hypothetical protein
MQFSNLSALSLSELKALATSNNVIPTGDKRSKKAWIDALELFAACETIADCDVWVAPETIADAEMERIAVEADTATTADSEHVSVTDYVDMPQTPVSDKKGAATVFSSLLCIIILAIQAILTIGCVITQSAIHLKNLFGAYNPDYDIFGQLHDMLRDRKASPAQQAQQPAY